MMRAATAEGFAPTPVLNAADSSSNSAHGRKPARTFAPLAASLALAVLATGLLLRADGVPREAAFMAGIFVLAALLWVTEALPLFATEEVTAK